jgi:tripeptidyl-peptidase-1
MSKSLTWVKFDATVEEAESLLKTEYNIYTHATTGKDHLAVEEYSVPVHIQEHVDFITPTVQFEATVELKAKRADLQGRSLKVKPTSQLIPDPLRVPLSEVTFNLTNCDRYITPECLRVLYGLSNGTLAL